MIKWFKNLFTKPAFRNFKKEEKLPFTHENLCNLNEEECVWMYEGNFMYMCYRVGNYVAINKAGRYFENAGSKGTYQYTCSNQIMVSYPKQMDDLVEHLLLIRKLGLQ